jgi:hypothetical protein
MRVGLRHTEELEEYPESHQGYTDLYSNQPQVQLALVVPDETVDRQTRTLGITQPHG